MSTSGHFFLTRVRSRVAILVVLAAVGVAGCDSEEKPAAQHHLGILHYVGNGGADFNHNAAADLTKAAAAQGYAPSHGFIAFHTENGDGLMFRKGDELALESYRKAADGGHCGSIKRLIRAANEGELGMSADPAAASALESKLPECIRR